MEHKTLTMDLLFDEEQRPLSSTANLWLSVR
jgi:hypothetical protein